jgi:uncharacterized protein YfeS
MSTPSRKTKISADNSKSAKKPAKKHFQSPAGSVSKEESLSRLAALLATEKDTNQKKFIKLIMDRIEKME